MPWKVSNDHAGCSGWAVVVQATDKVVGCHPTKDKALAHLAALNMNAKEASMATDEREVTESQERPPRDNIVRAISREDGGYTLKREDGEMPTLVGQFARFNEWTEIDSVFEGHFLERVDPGAFDKTMRKDEIKALFRHGKDPQIGDKVLGPINVLRSENGGGYYEVPLLDTSYNRDLIPGLEAGLYGNSFRGAVTREDYVRRPETSEHNPDGLPERTILEFRMRDLGPCTFPAYAGTSAGVMRSLTDEYLIEKVTSGAGLEKLAAVVKTQDKREDRPVAVAREKESKVETKDVSLDAYKTKGELVSRQTEIESRQQAINAEFATRQFDTAAQTEWDDLKDEKQAIRVRLAHLAERDAEIAENDAEDERGARRSKWGESERDQARTVQVRRDRDKDPFDMARTRQESRTAEEEERTLRDDAKGVVERATFPHPDADPDKVKGQIERMLGLIDGRAALSRRILATGSPTYKRAFQKALFGGYLTQREQEALAQPDEIERALSLTGSAGGFAVPFELDPTILNTSNGVVNPIRQVARVEQITVDEWRGVSSAGITAAYAAEATETTDNAPTLVQPTISTEKAQAFVPFSIEVGMDWDSLQNQMSVLLQDAKDTLEADKFMNGSGTNEPFGVLTGTTNTVNATSPQTFSLANLYSLGGALPPRYRPRAVYMADLLIANLVRQFDTAGGAALWVQLADGISDRMVGRPFYEASAMPDTPATGNKFLLVGDFSRFVIVDRIGLNVEVIQHLVGTNHRPTGQRGLYAYWRNGSKVVDANAFRALIGVA